MWTHYSFKLAEYENHADYLAVIEHPCLHLLYAFKVRYWHNGQYVIDCRFVEHAHGGTLAALIDSDEIDDRLQLIEDSESNPLRDDLNDLMRLARDCLPRDIYNEITQSKKTIWDFYKIVLGCIKGICTQREV
jgi:hypothetical protein